MAADWSYELTSQLRDAVAQRLRSGRASTGIRRRPDPHQPAPLSFAQQRLWLLSELFPAGLGYNVPRTHLLVGELDVDSLRRAFWEVVRRHEVLRSVFDRDAEGHPVQLVCPATPFELPVHRVRDRAQATRLAVELVRRPFNLGTGPLLRADLLRLGDREHVLVLCLHHIVIDEWSIDVLFAELSRLYAGFVAGEPADLPQLALQYADYAVWQRGHLTPDRLRRHLDHWRRHLDGAPQLRLPADHPRPGTQSFAGARLSHRVPAPVATRVRELAARHGATTFAALLAALHAMLAGHAADPDVTIAVPFSQRTRPELEPLIGFFVNTLPLRIAPGGAGLTFAELLIRAREVTFDALAHQDVPFDHLVRHLHPHRDLGHNPITQVALSHFGGTANGLRLPGLRVDDLPIDPGTVVFDLDFIVADDGDGLAVELAYSTDQFERPTARRMLDQFTDMLERIVADPSQRPDRLVPRRDLPASSGAGPASGAGSSSPAGPTPAAGTGPAAAPSTEIERTLAAIWGRVLGRDTVGTTDDFFVIGGDSLGAARVAVQVSRKYRVPVPMRAMFDAPTISRFATEVLAPLLGGNDAADVRKRLSERLATMPPEQALRMLTAARDENRRGPTPQEDQ